MIENLSYEEIEGLSKELKASTEVIGQLIEGKELPELQNFINDVNNYARFLDNTIKLNRSADSALEYLKSTKGASN